MLIKVRPLNASAKLPKRQHPTDAGLDLYAAEPATLAPGEAKLIGTGVAIELPPSTCGLIVPRSGWAARQGLTILNSPGILDQGYRGEVRVLLHNQGDETIWVDVHQRIAQLVVVPVVLATVEPVAKLSESERGDKGFGSTGAADDQRQAA